MLEVRAGDTASFELLLVKYRGPLIGYLGRMVRDPAWAEELAQEVFLRVYRARETYEPTARFATWLYRIATRLALNALRDHRHEKSKRSLDEELDGRPVIEAVDGRANREQQMLADARLSAVREAIAQLPDKQRAAVLMHKYQEMDYQQIADALGCSVSAVKSLLFRAYETLRERLAHLATSPKADRAILDGGNA